MLHQRLPQLIGLVLTSGIRESYALSLKLLKLKPRERVDQKRDRQRQPRQQQDTAVQERAVAEPEEARLQLCEREKLTDWSQLVASLVHEMNNPLNFIAGNLVFAQQYVHDLLLLVRLYQQHCPPLPEQAAAEIAAIEPEFLLEDLPKLLMSMQVGSDRIQQILRSLRSFTRADAAEPPQPVNLHDSIDRTLLLLRVRLDGKASDDCLRVSVIKEYGDLPLVECYGGALDQVMMNLLLNAIDALEDKAAQPGTTAPEFRPWIRIRTEMLANQHAAIHIADNGIGMTKAVQQRLFEPFFTTKAIGKGTGLGLAISYHILVDQHQGQLHCHSVPGYGTTFTVQIPCCQPARDRQTAASAPLPKSHEHKENL